MKKLAVLILFLRISALAQLAAFPAGSGPTAPVGKAPIIVLFGPQTAASPSCTRTSGGVFATLTHYWKLNEASGASRADSVGSLTLTETGGEVTSASGECENAANFLGTPTRSLTSSAFTLSAPFSIAFWFKVPSPVGGDGNGGVFLTKDDSADGPILFQMLSDSGGQVLSMHVGDLGDNFASHAVSLDTWHLVVVSINAAGDNCNLYIDGSLDPDSGIAMSSTTSDGALHIGDASTAIKGMVDEVMIFSTALTQANVTALWNSGAGTFYTP